MMTTTTMAITNIVYIKSAKRCRMALSSLSSDIDLKMVLHCTAKPDRPFALSAKFVIKCSFSRKKYIFTFCDRVHFSCTISHKKNGNCISKHLSQLSIQPRSNILMPEPETCLLKNQIWKCNKYTTTKKIIQIFVYFYSKYKIPYSSRPTREP